MIELVDDHPSIIALLLNFIYVAEYDDYGSNGASPDNQLMALMINIYMYAAADKYEIQSLQELAENKFSVAIHKAAWKAPDFPELVNIVYTTTPASDRGLRDIVLKAVNEHRVELNMKKDLMEVVRTNGDFAVDLVNSAWSSWSTGTFLPSQLSVAGKKLQRKRLLPMLREEQTCTVCGFKLSHWDHCAQCSTRHKQIQ